MLESVKDSNKIFNGFMSMMLISCLVIMIFERYVNRCNTKPIKDRSIEDAGQEKNFSSIIKRWVSDAQKTNF